MTDLNKAKEVGQQLRYGVNPSFEVLEQTIYFLLAEVERLTVQLDSMQRHESTLEDKDREIERLTKVDVEPVAYHYCYTNAFGYPVWNVGFHVPSEATESHDLVYASALAAEQAKVRELVEVLEDVRYYLRSDNYSRREAYRKVGAAIAKYGEQK